jgi:hypothetical protein
MADNVTPHPLDAESAETWHAPANDYPTPEGGRSTWTAAWAPAGLPPIIATGPVGARWAGDSLPDEQATVVGSET